MSYTFLIGNAVPEFDKEGGILSARWRVESAESDSAPTFPNDDMTGNGNDRSPSYSAWHAFCREAGIYDVFYDERGHLHAGHPGCVMITKDDLDRVRSSLEMRKEIATLPPGFEGWPKFNKETQTWESDDVGKYDSTLARLIWLEWWMCWALENCETPAIENY